MPQIVRGLVHVVEYLTKVKGGDPLYLSSVEAAKGRLRGALEA